MKLITITAWILLAVFTNAWLIREYKHANQLIDGVVDKNGVKLTNVEYGRKSIVDVIFYGAVVNGCSLIVLISNL